MAALNTGIKRSWPVVVLALFAFTLSCGVTTTARAAQDVTVEKDNAPVREDPKDGGKIIDYLQTGDDLRISSYPVNQDYYKVRARNGQYGWVHRKYLSIRPVEEEEDPNKPIEPLADRLWALRVFGGYALTRPADLNDIFNFSELNGAYNVGGELGYAVGTRFSLLFRVESLIKDVVAKETTTGLIYNLALRSYPVMVGLDFKFIKEGPIRLGLSAYAGIGVGTHFTAEVLTQSEPNQTTLSSNSLTTLLRLNLTRPLGRTFSIFSGLGYRYLRTVALDTTNSNNGGRVFSISGVYRTRVIDLSGFMADIGVGLHF